MKFVENVKSCWKWLSMQAMALNVAFLATWTLLPVRFQEAISQQWVVGIAITLLVLGMIGRTVKQAEVGKP